MTLEPRAARRKFLLAAAAAAVTGPVSARAAMPPPVPEHQRRTVRDLGVKGDGRRDESAAIRAAMEVNDALFFPAGDYHLGEARDGATVFDLRRRLRPLSILGEEGTRFIVETRGEGVPAVFLIRGGGGFRLDNVTIEDRGLASSQRWRNAYGVLVSPGATETATAEIGRIRGVRLNAVVSTRGIAGPRIRGVRIAHLVAQRCYYGFVAADNGDEVTIERLEAEECLRSYFVYGVRDHRVVVRSRRNGAASADVLIKRYSLDTTGIRVDYEAIGSRNIAPNGLVVLEQQVVAGSEPAAIADIDLRIACDSPESTASPLLLRAYTPDAKLMPTTDASWIRICARFGKLQTKAPLALECLSRPERPAGLSICGVERARVAPSALAAFQARIDPALCGSCPSG